MNCSVLSHRVLLNPYLKWPHWLKYTRAAHVQGRCHTVWMQSVKGSSNLINDRGREADIWAALSCLVFKLLHHFLIFSPCETLWHFTDAVSTVALHSNLSVSSWGDRCLKGMNTREKIFSTKRETSSFCNRTNSIVTFKKFLTCVRNNCKDEWLINRGT